MEDKKMPVTLSIKNVPDEMAERLRFRAQKNHRSLQGELMAILQDTVEKENELTPARILAEVRNLDLNTASETVEWIRKDRDAH